MRACRTCLSKYDLYPLFGETEFTSDQLYLSTGIMITPEDGLPQTACKACIKTITNTLHLRELSAKADSFLKTITRHDFVKVEQNIQDTIENILGLFPEETDQNTPHLIQEKETDDVTNLNENDLNETDDITSSDDIKPTIYRDNTYLSNNKDIYETEFVNIETKKEYIEDTKTESRNCLTLSKDAQIMLYPSKCGGNIESKSNDPVESIAPTIVVLCDSMKMEQLEKISKETNMKYVIKCSIDNISKCTSEICQTIFKNKQNDSANAISQTIVNSGSIANVSGQTANISGEAPNISGQKANISGQTVNKSGQITDMSGPVPNIRGLSPYIFGQTPRIFIQTANPGQKAKASDQTDRIENDFISRKELTELFKDSYKFDKTLLLSNANKDSKSHELCTENDCKSSENSNKKSAKIYKKSSSNRKLSKKDDQMVSEDDYDTLFGNLMSNLKKKLAKCTPKDSQENNVIKQNSNIMKPIKMDLTRRKYFRERNNKLMSLAVTPYKEGGPIECKVCHNVVQKKHSFRSHALKHFEKQHVCKFAGCGKKFVHRGQLSRHEQCLHGVEKKFSCGQCGFRAADRLTMQNHIRAEHTGEKPYECNECGAKFRMRNNIIQHIKQVHFKPHKNIQCEYCPSLFQCRRDLWMHQDKSHFYTYNYYCYLCSNTYRSGCSARKHLLKVHGVPKNQQLKLRRDKIRKADAPSSSNVKPIVSNTPR